jgi:hypothetical protein
MVRSARKRARGQPTVFAGRHRWSGARVSR